MVKLIVSDLDDTLLTDKLTISQADMDAIAQAQAQGMIFTIATGRMFVATLPFAKQLGLPPERPIICYNGAVVQSVSGQVVYENPIRHELALDIVEYCTSQGWTTNVYYHDALYVSEINSDVEYYLSFAEVPTYPVGNLGEFLQEERKAPPKILIISPEELNSTRQNLLVERYGQDTQIVQSKRRYLEITSADAHKASALEWVVQKLGITMGEVLAIGDSNNDVEMLRRAGIGVAVANAVPAAKTAADYIAASNSEGGVAEAIRRYALV